MIRINYTSWLSTKLGKDYDELPVPPDVDTVAALLDWLQGKGGVYETVLKTRHVIYAYQDSQVIPHDAPLDRDREITLFAPIAGG